MVEFGTIIFGQLLFAPKFPELLRPVVTVLFFLAQGGFLVNVVYELHGAVRKDAASSSALLAGGTHSTAQPPVPSPVVATGPLSGGGVQMTSTNTMYSHPTLPPL